MYWSMRDRAAWDRRTKIFESLPAGVQQIVRDTSRRECVAAHTYLSGDWPAWSPDTALQRTRLMLGLAEAAEVFAAAVSPPSPCGRYHRQYYCAYCGKATCPGALQPGGNHRQLLTGVS